MASSNPLAHPVIDPNFLATTWDIGVLRESIKMIQRFVAAPAWDDYIIGPYGDFANAITDDQIDAYARSNAATFFHPISTASMSPKGANWGVVDPDLTVKGVEGLRIADASVIVRVPLPSNPGTWGLTCHDSYSTAVSSQWSHSSTCLPLRGTWRRPHQSKQPCLRFLNFLAFLKSICLF